jgi:hypothetical protein
LPVELRLINGDFSPVHPLIGTLAAVGIDLVKHGVFRVRVRWAAMAWRSLAGRCTLWTSTSSAPIRARPRAREHWWFEDRGPQCTLLVFVDDATGRLFAWKEERTLSQALTLQYDKVMFILEPSEHAKTAIGKRITVIDYPDGRLSIRHKGVELAYRTFDKIRQVDTESARGAGSPA